MNEDNPFEYEECKNCRNNPSTIKFNERMDKMIDLIYRLQAETEAKVANQKWWVKSVLGLGKIEAVVMSLVVSIGINILFLLAK